MSEKWRPVVGFEEAYEVSDLGMIRRTAAGRRTSIGRLKSTAALDSHGYPSVRLNFNGRALTRNVYKLVAEAFLGPMPSGHNVNHKDGDKKNSRLSNLEYCTPSQNNIHAYATGLRRPLRGRLNGRSKLDEQTAVRIKKALRAGALRKDIAVDFGLGIQTIHHIARGDTWWYV